MSAGGVDSSALGPVPIFDHLDRMTDSRGLFEHTDRAMPRREHGYCVDDVARGLVVVCREPRPEPRVRRLARCYLGFVLDAFDSTGACHNRMDVDGVWTDEPGLGDWWGRAVWSLGVAARSAETAGARARALTGFRVAAQKRSPDRRSMAFAALGAAELLSYRPEEVAAESLLSDAVVAIGVVGSDADWQWPEDRLSYGNGTLAEAMIVAGSALIDDAALEQGLGMLDFLLRTETRDGHLSVTPVGGRGREGADSVFDQQPIEVAAIADACASAYAATEDSRWLDGIDLAWRWFVGDNDGATSMFDPTTGGGYDGLQVDGRNLNQGAESTLAMLATAQHARRHSAYR